MGRCNSRIGLAFAALALVGAVGQGFAAERPFKLSGQGTLLFNPEVTPSGPFTAAGHATHLGAWENLGNITFVEIGPGLLAADGDVTFWAANGDRLEMALEGVLDRNTGRATGTFVITGGTGRFTDAEGTLRMVLDQAPDGSFAFTLDGGIDY